MMIDFYKLMLVTKKGQQSISDYLKFLQECISCGVTSVQMREKNLLHADKIKFAIQLKKMLDSLNIPLIINDDLDIAINVNADGVHLGASDHDVINARNLLGDKKIIGYSVTSNNDAILANSLPIDYIGCGAVFNTRNKYDAVNIGLEGLKNICSISTKKTVAIGGINVMNISYVLDCGVSGVAAIEAFHNSSNICDTVKKMYDMIISRTSC